MVRKKSAPRDESNITHMSFEAPTELRNAFKAKAASQGKSVKEVIVAFMEEYVKSKK